MIKHTVQIELSDDTSSEDLHEMLCKTIHEMDLEELDKLYSIITDIEIIESTQLEGVTP